jgi:hypothetical protein
VGGLEVVMFSDMRSTLSMHNIHYGTLRAFAEQRQQLSGGWLGLATLGPRNSTWRISKSEQRRLWRLLAFYLSIIKLDCLSSKFVVKRRRDHI